MDWMTILLSIIYLAFISLGLPDSLLGSAWPVMHLELGVATSYAGIITMIISFGTILSSLMSDRLNKKFGTGLVTTCSVFLTAAALFGFSCSNSMLALCLWAIPYGLGAGAVDAALNNYVALHYSSRQMSWLHCMWGLGTSLGPYIMGYVLTGGQRWNMGYRYISCLQFMLTAILVCSLPLWKKVGGNAQVQEEASSEPLSLKKILSISGAKEVMLTFFCYCGIEQTAILWASSYLVFHSGFSAEKAAGLAALFFIGITVGRALSGFITMKLSDPQMIRMGQAIILAGILIMLLPVGFGSQAGLLMIGLGCAPIYPCIIHSTPDHFGADKSQAVIGVQMASAYMGSLLMPPVFGLIAQNLSISLLPMFFLLLLILMVFMHEKLLRLT